MNMRRLGFLAVVGVAALAGSASLVVAADVPFRSRANTPPRKIVVASALVNFSGGVDARLTLAHKLIDEAAAKAAGDYAGAGLDLMVFPEFAIARPGPTAADQSVTLAGRVGEVVGAMAREHHTWVVMPMTLREADGARFSNAAVLFDREGKASGIYRKTHPIVDAHGVFEDGVTPGDDYPVFDCDFGRLGILICWDMGYPEAWSALADAGAEIVALPSASPQTLRPAASALDHRVYVVNSAPRDDASVFDPLGRTIAQVTEAPGVVVKRIDLAYAILHWNERLNEGRAFTERFGPRAGYDYTRREDTGIFWSNDPTTSIGDMVRALDMREMPDVIAAVGAATDQARAAKH
ncbi:MAG TPA: carbon-nitrogen hydrolase family protein [Opitutus sp.]|nr:carbon-nitrogen hydrolase family protein [Opitutus sp.]